MITTKILRSITIVLLVHIAMEGVGYVAGSNHFNDDVLTITEFGDEIRAAKSIYKYEVIDLGTLPGENASTASSINNSGQVVGTSRTEGLGYSYATLFDTSGSGNNIYLGTLGGNFSRAQSINDSGQIVGSERKPSEDHEHATLFDPNGGGNNIDLGILGVEKSSAYSINNTGQIVGWGNNSLGNACAALFDPSGAGNNIDLRTLGGPHASARAINNHGQIVGSAYDGLDRGRATLFDPTGNGNNIDLGTLPGHDHSHADSINDSGQIVGFSIDSSYRHHATLFDISGSGNNVYLGTLGGRWSRAQSINSSGQIVGSAGDSFDQSRACLFDPTGAGNNIDLNTMIDPGSGWILKYALSINNYGWIVGGGTNPDGFNRAYLLIARPVIYYVDMDAKGANNGSSWKDAYYYLQDALAVATEGDEIRVAQGIYKPAIYVTPPPPLPMDSSNDQNPVASAVDRTATFHLKNGVVIKGGYAGFGAPDANARDVEKYKTILSGDLYGNDDGFDNTGENCYRVVTGSGTNATAVLDGFTVTASCGERRDKCGGVYNVSGSPTITNCTFIDNWTDYGHSGNGMYNRFSSPIVTNCIFDGSNYNNGMLNEISSLTINNCIFIEGDQCGIESYGGNLILTNCLFSSNNMAVFIDYCHPIIKNCTFTRNGSVIGYDGGAKATLTNCIIWDNGESFYAYIINYSCVQNGGYTGVGNITKDPLFVDPDNGDFRLHSGSPCINAGDPNYPFEPNETDLDGKPRVISGRIDMGAYESPTIIFVDVNATGANNGSSWIDAYNCLQDALAVAFSGDEIRIAEGIYKPDQGIGITAGDRTVAFELVNGVAVKGGYAGFGATDANARDIEIYKTILSGDLRGNDNWISRQYDMEDDESREDNSHHVVRATDNDSTAVFDGCTIIGGYADCTAHRFMGGGMYIYKASPTVTNCTFTGNWALNYGGGICVDTDSQPVITNCNFIANSSTDGAGADNEYSNPTFVNCLFADNWAWEYNADSYGGAGMYNFYSNPTVINCVFAVNGSPGWGDGGGMQNNNGSPTLINCTFYGNYSANGGTRAGGIYNLYESSPRLTNCILWGNTNPGAQGQSAQIYGGHPIINYCCIEGWTGELGGTGNIGADPCFVEASCWVPDYYLDESSDDDLPLWGDYQLLQTSPCIDIADNNSLPDDIGDLDTDGDTVEPLPFDIDGNPRIFDGDNDNIPVVDMGAYEFLNKPPIADAGPDQVAECVCNTAQGTKVTLDGTNSRDPDRGPLTYIWTGPFVENPVQGATPTITLEGGCPGEYVITLVVNDGMEDSEPNEVVITVVDTTPPEFELSVMPTMLWPPNHKMVEIKPSWTVSDECDASPDVSLVSIVANESDDTIGDDNTSDDIEVGDDGSIFVRSERSGNNVGRIYIITYQAVDETGNVTVRSANVSVPHDFKLLARMGERWLWRSNAGNLPEDLNGDGIINLKDIAIFANNWIR